MLCDNCNKNEASIHIQEVVGSKKKTFHLCTECASAHNLIGENTQNVDLTAVICNLAAKALEQEQPALEDTAADNKPSRICDNCGLTDVDLRKHGRLGCSECYEAFADILHEIFSEVHRGKSHVGRVPDLLCEKNECDSKEMNALPVLEYELKRAVASEAYERAAEIRDRIKQVSLAQKESRTQ